MSNNVILVSEEKVKAFSSINDNVSVELLLPSIGISQDIGLQSLLGTKFLDHLKDAVSNNTLTSAESLLLDEYISAYLIHRGYWEVLPDIFFRMKNKGISIGLSENSSPASVDDMRYLRSIQQNRFEFYQHRMLDFIKNNQSDYPDYFSWSSTDGMKPIKAPYFGGIHITSGRRKPLPNNLGGINSGENYNI